MGNQLKAVWTAFPSHVTVVAVTKTFPPETVLLARSMGFTHIGENRTEEARKKIQQARKLGATDIHWHMIGHVQSRKAQEVAGLFDWVDSVDSEKIARKLNEAAGAAGKSLSVLVEVNISAEKNKYGVDIAGWEENSEKLAHIIAMLRACVPLSSLQVKGLMTMAPFVTDPEKNRAYFQSMKRLSQTIRVHVPSFGQELSMGTSCDYQVAIEEGATQVRLGTALFGQRG